MKEKDHRPMLVAPLITTNTPLDIIQINYFKLSYHLLQQIKQE